MNIYQVAVWNELKNTLATWDSLVEKSQKPETAHLVKREELDRLRHRINGLLSQLEQAA